jgi:hypothetical protein
VVEKEYNGASTKKENPMPPSIPNYDLGILITFNIGLTMIGILGAMIGVWAILRQNIRMAEIVERTSRSTERVAEIAERIDARLRRQYTDIDRDLQEIKEMLGGQ